MTVKSLFSDDSDSRSSRFRSYSTATCSAKEKCKRTKKSATLSNHPTSVCKRSANTEATNLGGLQTLRGVVHEALQALYRVLGSLQLNAKRRHLRVGKRLLLLQRRDVAP